MYLLRHLLPSAFLDFNPCLFQKPYQPRGSPNSLLSLPFSVSIPVSPLFCLYTCLSPFLSACLSLVFPVFRCLLSCVYCRNHFLSLYLSLPFSVSMSVSALFCLPACPSFFLSLRLSLLCLLFLSLSLPLCLTVCLYVCLCPFLPLPDFLFYHFKVRLSHFLQFVCIFLCLAVSLLILI